MGSGLVTARSEIQPPCERRSAVPPQLQVFFARLIILLSHLLMSTLLVPRTSNTSTSTYWHCMSMKVILYCGEEWRARVRADGEARALRSRLPHGLLRTHLEHHLSIPPRPLVGRRGPMRRHVRRNSARFQHHVAYDVRRHVSTQLAEDQDHKQDEDGQGHYAAPGRALEQVLGDLPVHIDAPQEARRSTTGVHAASL